MSEHTHIWSPIQGERGQYRCADCPATGYRTSAGEIRPHKQARQRRSQLTARPVTFGGRIDPHIPEDFDAGRERE